jgi:hypothetical protein
MIDLIHAIDQEDLIQDQIMIGADLDEIEIQEIEVLILKKEILIHKVVHIQIVDLIGQKIKIDQETHLDQEIPIDQKTSINPEILQEIHLGQGMKEEIHLSVHLLQAEI